MPPPSIQIDLAGPRTPSPDEPSNLIPWAEASSSAASNGEEKDAAEAAVIDQQPVTMNGSSKSNTGDTTVGSSNNNKNRKAGEANEIPAPAAAGNSNASKREVSRFIYIPSSS